jgi:hypothetical protein
MSDEKEYICSLCGQVWKTLPEDAVQLTHFGGRSRTNTYKFADGTIHTITKKARSAEEHQ